LARAVKSAEIEAKGPLRRSVGSRVDTFFLMVDPAVISAVAGVSGAIIGVTAKWGLDELGYVRRRPERVRERTYADRARHYVDFLWAVDAILDKARSEHGALIRKWVEHETGMVEMPQLMRGAFMARDKVLLVSTDPVREAARRFAEVVTNLDVTDVEARREAFREAAIAELREG